MPKSPATALNLSSDELLLTRIVGALWALLGLLALLATVEPIRADGTSITAMRVLGLGAAAVACVVLLLPEERRTRGLLDPLIAVTIVYIGALAYAGGGKRVDLLLPLIFVVVISAYFLPWQRSMAHLGLTQAVLGGYLALADGVPGNHIASLSIATTSLWALVSILRRDQLEREAQIRAAHEVLDPETGLLSQAGLDQALDAELSRAARHARPLSLICLEVDGPDFAQADPDERRRVATTLARTLVSRVRTEDRAARVDRLRFAVLAPETSEAGAAAVANSLSEQLRRRLLTLGYHPDSFSVAVGWADYQYDELPKDELVKSADAALAAAILGNEGISFPAHGVELRPKTPTHH